MCGIKVKIKSTYAVKWTNARKWCVLYALKKDIKPVNTELWVITDYVQEFKDIESESCETKYIIQPVYIEKDGSYSVEDLQKYIVSRLELEANFLEVYI